MQTIGANIKLEGSNHSKCGTKSPRGEVECTSTTPDWMEARDRLKHSRHSQMLWSQSSAKWVLGLSSNLIRAITKHTLFVYNSWSRGLEKYSHISSEYERCRFCPDVPILEMRSDSVCALSNWKYWVCIAWPQRAFSFTKQTSHMKGTLRRHKDAKALGEQNQSRSAIQRRAHAHTHAFLSYEIFRAPQHSVHLVCLITWWSEDHLSCTIHRFSIHLELWTRT